MNAHLDLGVECGAKEIGNEDVVRGAVGDDAPTLEEHDARRMPRDRVEVVRGDDAPDPPGFGDARKGLVKLEAVPDVEVCRWFVEEQQLWLLREGAGDGDAPLLAAAQRLDRSIRQSFEVGAGHGLRDRLFVCGIFGHPGALMRRSPHGHNFAHAKASRHGFVLGDEGDDASDVSPRELAHIGSADADRALERLEQSGAHAEQRRLAGAIRADERNHLGRAHAQGHT